jgi:hypothetical protein
VYLFVLVFMAWGLAALEFGGAEEKAGGEGRLAVYAGEIVAVAARGDGQGVALAVLDSDLTEACFLLVGIGADLSEDGLAGAVAYGDVEEIFFKRGCFGLRGEWDVVLSEDCRPVGGDSGYAV